MRNTYYGNYNYMDRVDERRQVRKSSARTVRIRRRKKSFLLIGIIVTIILCTIFSVKAFAGTKECKGDFGMKQYKSVMIYCGDTVESLAEKNFSFPFSSSDKLADEIRSINHLSSDEKLIAGNYLIIPYFAL